MNEFINILNKNKRIIILLFVAFSSLASIYLAIAPQKYTATLDVKLGQNGGKIILDADEVVEQLRENTALQKSLINLFIERNGNDNTGIVIASLSDIKSLPTKKNIYMQVTSTGMERSNTIAEDLGLSIEELFLQKYISYTHEIKRNNLVNEKILRNLLNSDLNKPIDYNNYYEMIKNITKFIDENSEYKTFPTKIYSLKLAKPSSFTPKPITIYAASTFLWLFLINLLIFFRVIK